MNSFLQGKKSLAMPALRLPPGLAASPAPARATPHVSLASAATPHVAGPNVEVVKEGDKVVRLVVTCACGERVEIECLYPAGG
jgi:hypothetical protein